MCSRRSSNHYLRRKPLPLLAIPAIAIAGLPQSVNKLFIGLDTRSHVTPTVGRPSIYFLIDMKNTSTRDSVTTHTFFSDAAATYQDPFRIWRCQVSATSIKIPEKMDIRKWSKIDLSIGNIAYELDRKLDVNIQIMLPRTILPGE